MNFLNEVVQRFPEAISFAPGRPLEETFNVETSLGSIRRFAEHLAKSQGISRRQAFSSLGQYGRTKGLIHDLVAEHLRQDEDLDVPAEAVMITTGCQEAMLILSIALFEPGQDVLLVADPTYIGISGLATLLGIEMAPVPMTDDGVDLSRLPRLLRRLEAEGKRGRALYLIPDFNNPMGTCMPMVARQRLLDLASEEGLLLFEDSPYRMLAYDRPAAPTLKTMDHCTNVIYLGSFAKTLFPGLRLGYLVADQPSGSGSGFLVEDLSKVKSLTTVNTAPLMQAVVGGLLLEHGGSLRSLVQPKLERYRSLRDRLLLCLQSELGACGIVRPAGGFFLTLELPFEFDNECLSVCAREYGVICVPLSFFSLTPGRERQIRLSFSYVNEKQIEEGVRRLAAFVRWRKERW